MNRETPLNASGAIMAIIKEATDIGDMDVLGRKGMDIMAAMVKVNRPMMQR